MIASFDKSHALTVMPPITGKQNQEEVCPFCFWPTPKMLVTTNASHLNKILFNLQAVFFEEKTILSEKMHYVVTSRT